MNITRYGRVEADLNLIPVPASGIPDGSVPFAAALAAAQKPAPAATPRAPDKPKAAAEEPEPAPEREAKQHTASTSTEQVPVETAAAAPPQLTPAAAEAPGVTPAPRGGEPDRQSDAGKGTGSPLTSKPLPAAAEGLPQVAPAAGDAVVPVAAAAAAPPAPVRGSGNAATPPASGVTAGSAPLRTPAAVAAYRTLTPQAAQMVESARDSVFKQIMLKLGKESSEMRVRLEPPELGQLDVQVSVEKGGQMKLWLDAQRPELAAMLDRNLEALKQTLGQQGFTVVHAEVRDGNRSDRRRWETDGSGAGGGTGAEAELAAAPAQRQGWITANGLDFWV